MTGTAASDKTTGAGAVDDVAENESPDPRDAVGPLTILDDLGEALAVVAGPALEVLLRVLREPASVLRTEVGADLGVAQNRDPLLLLLEPVVGDRPDAEGLRGRDAADGTEEGLPELLVDQIAAVELRIDSSPADPTRVETPYLRNAMDQHLAGQPIDEQLLRRAGTLYVSYLRRQF